MKKEEPFKFLLNIINLNGICLNIGCQDSGKGYILNKMGMEVTFLDINSNILKKIRNTLKKRVKIVNKDILKFKTNEKFDVILINRLLHLFGEKEIKKIMLFVTSHLKKGGYCQITWPTLSKSYKFKKVLKIVPSSLILIHKRRFIKIDSKKHFHLINSIILKK